MKEMSDPFTLTSLAILVATNAPSWLNALRSTLLDKGKEITIDKGKEIAIEKGVTTFVISFILTKKTKYIILSRHLKMLLNAVLPDSPLQKNEISIALFLKFSLKMVPIVNSFARKPFSFLLFLVF